MTDIAEIVDVSDTQLLRRALIDAAESMGRYAITSNHSTDGAIRFLENLRQGFDQARMDRPALLRRRKEAS